MGEGNGICLTTQFGETLTLNPTPPANTAVVEPTIKADERVYAALHAAVKDANVERVVELLAAYPSLVNTLHDSQESLLSVASRMGNLTLVKLLLSKNNEAIDKHGGQTDPTPLFAACLQGHIEIAKLLVDHGASVHAVEPDTQKSVLYAACFGGHLELVKWLVVDRNADLTAADIYGLTPLLAAVHQGHFQVVQYLVDECGVNVDDMTTVGESALYIACSCGYLDIVQFMINKEADVNAVVFDTRATALHIAVEKQHFEIVRALVAAGAMVDAFREDDVTPLYLAAFHGNLQIVECLIYAGANIRVVTEAMETAVYAAACKGYTHVLAFLLEYWGDSDIDWADKTVLSPMHMAAQNGHVDVLRLLLSVKYASVDADDGRGSTPLLYATAYEQIKVMRLLLEQGANPNVRVDNDQTCLHLAIKQQNGVEMTKLLLQYQADVNSRDLQGLTPLHAAAETGETAIIDLLLAHGGDINAVAENGYAPVHIAASFGQVMLLEHLVHLGYKHAVLHSKVDKEGLTPLLCAINNGNVNAVQFLLTLHEQENENIDLRGEKGTEMLLLAAERGHTRVVELLVLNGANGNSKGSNQFTPLQAAAANGHSEVVKFMFNHGATTGDFDKADHRSVVHIAAENGHAQVVNYLLEHTKINVDSTTYGGTTPLHLAAKNGHEDVVRVLLAHGANLEAKADPDGTPLAVAVRSQHRNVVQLLQANGAIH